jgi:predicted MPP superfamily phosphohydrolase
MYFDFKLIFVLVFILAVDFYTFKGIKTTLFKRIHVGGIKKFIIYFFWSVTLIFIAISIFIFIRKPGIRNVVAYKHIYFLVGLVVLFYIPKLFFIVFHFIEDIVHYIQLIHYLRLAKRSIRLGETLPQHNRITLISEIGIVLALIPFLSIIYGISAGRYNYQVNNIELEYDNLPSKFDNLKIVQISDFHIGSFYGNKNQVAEIVDLVNEQNADFIFFTGDMVNNTAAEMDSFMTLLSGIKSKSGKYAILGNHDYGDYNYWKSGDEKEANFFDLKHKEKLLGFDLLLNENRIIGTGDERIAVIGVENWGLPPFKQYGRLKEAIKGTENIRFKILLSHDPSEWDEEVVGKTNIDLTLSGHTHGMQLGFRISGLKWSPAEWKYPRWAGLYHINTQYLYVNVGLGYIGFPGRIGIRPEITVIELHCKNL